MKCIDYDCYGKQKMSYMESLKRAKKARRNSNDVVINYRCPKCHQWHIGHPTDKGSR